MANIPMTSEEAKRLEASLNALRQTIQKNIETTTKSAERQLGNTLEKMVTGSADSKDLGQTIKQVGKQYEEIGQQLLDDLASSVKKSFYRSMRENLVKPLKKELEDLLGKSFEEIANSISQMAGNLGKYLGETVSEFLGSLFSGSSGGGGGGLFGWLGGLFGGSSGGGAAGAVGDFTTTGEAAGMGAAVYAANGGIMTSGGPVPLRRYAGGGIARTSQAAIFGEGSLPEAYVPLPDGRSIPVTMAGGGAPSVNVSYNIDATGADPAAIARLQRQLDHINATLPGRIVAVVSDTARRGGAAAKAIRGR
ncbi:MAG: hypothetical protein HYU60_00035 [Magnetospirillum sp.]|nr:hypothetical protein [Magnetospirillum sp.]